MQNLIYKIDNYSNRDTLISQYMLYKEPLSHWEIKTVDVITEGPNSLILKSFVFEWL